MLTFCAGFVVGMVVTFVVLLVLARASGDVVDQFIDEHSEHLGADSRFHGERR